MGILKNLIWFIITTMAISCGCKSNKSVVKNNDDLSFTVNGVSFTMKHVQGGSFYMGAQSQDPNGKNYDSEAGEREAPVHQVEVKSFYILETLVTQELWVAIMKTSVEDLHDPLSIEKVSELGNDYPMYFVSWDDCMEFITKLNNIIGQRFCLPSDAEWEFAARGGIKSHGYKYSGSNNLDEVGWSLMNSGNEFINDKEENEWSLDNILSNHCRVHKVKTKAPNELGIYDMSGNVWEWCNDTWYLYGDENTDRNSDSHIVRGGCFIDPSYYNRVTYRGYSFSNSRDQYIGFRLVLHN